ncbi:hypothetical protein [Halorubrum ezzemoulense]|uniref:hypothetical protein n=1 Tax=Halorubrum ezzemoulense TaxID=337243 RepID=UPI00232B15CE|nr:hypothetical protein [Halorubrum ezzemoulense]MDB2239110.1 hypothetical protein [Halorubrum ezzemoulense]
MIEKIRKTIRFPEAAKRKAAATLVRPFVFDTFPDESHVDTDWDNLIILDGCRYDTFQEYNPFSESVKEGVSNASHTTDFLTKNLLGDQSDTVYVTASPQVTKCESRFHTVVHVWQKTWDEELRTVPPQSVTEAAIQALEEYPNKRLVVHYMQPHYPFIGPTGRELETHATFTGGLRKREHPSIWEMLSSGEVSREEVKKAYEENLEIVLDKVVTLTGQIDGKTVITSDHGNLFGERVSPLPVRIYGHPSNLPAKGLTSVPYVELEHDKRRSLSKGNREEQEEEHKEVKSRLEDLGYV